MKNPFIEDFKNDLKNYKNIENSIMKIQEEIEFIEGITDPKGLNTSAFNFGGSDFNSMEYKMFDYLAKKEALEIQLKINERKFSKITKAFEILDKTEKLVIEEYYFKRTNINKVCKLLNYEVSQIYKISNKAIIKMVCFLYGKVNC